VSKRGRPIPGVGRRAQPRCDRCYRPVPLTDLSVGRALCAKCLDALPPAKWRELLKATR
jgi:hypothetical protein